MMETFFLVGLPYLAIVVCVAGSVYRYRSDRFSYSALSSQFLESRSLRWGSVPWHAGIIVILLGHLIPFLAPGLWASVLANRTALVAIEATGIAMAVLCLIGMLVLVVRRLVSSRIQAVTTTTDLVVQALLVVQIGLGLATAVQYRWGAVWATSTVVPYVWSILTFAPDPTYVAGMPGLVKAHIAVAWLLIALVPFSRLVHMFSLPLGYLARAPQLVVWSNVQRANRAAAARVVASRRYFVTGTVASASGAALLGVGVADKLGRFFQGPRLTPEQQSEVLEERLVRVKLTAEQRELELERLRNDYIAVGRLAELDPKKGKYFIDYEMRPALAFLGEDGLPLLISAKCTHLGCTVASEVNEEGKILCPCHISYFDVKTGEPNPGAPAKTPLPHLEWALMDPAGTIVGSRTAAPTLAGADLAACTVYIAKRGGESA
jgi:nitrate reductase gamma subunit